MFSWCIKRRKFYQCIMSLNSPFINSYWYEHQANTRINMRMRAVCVGSQLSEGSSWGLEDSADPQTMILGIFAQVTLKGSYTHITMYLIRFISSRYVIMLIYLGYLMRFIYSRYVTPYLIRFVQCSSYVICSFAQVALLGWFIQVTR